MQLIAEKDLCQKRNTALKFGMVWGAMWNCKEKSMFYCVLLVDHSAPPPLFLKKNRDNAVASATPKNITLPAKYFCYFTQI